jgi:hypothetical protein
VTVGQPFFDEGHLHRVVRGDDVIEEVLARVYLIAKISISVIQQHNIRDNFGHKYAITPRNFTEFWVPFCFFILPNCLETPSIYEACKPAKKIISKQNTCPRNMGRTTIDFTIPRRRIRHRISPKIPSPVDQTEKRADNKARINDTPMLRVKESGRGSAPKSKPAMNESLHHAVLLLIEGSLSEL